MGRDLNAWKNRSGNGCGEKSSVRKHYAIIASPPDNREARWNHQEFVS
jgi:hypothetical protein